jgi:hypothetical protein
METKGRAVPSSVDTVAVTASIASPAGMHYVNKTVFQGRTTLAKNFVACLERST